MRRLCDHEREFVGRLIEYQAGRIQDGRILVSLAVEDPCILLSGVSGVQASPAGFHLVEIVTHLFISETFN